MNLNRTQVHHIFFLMEVMDLKESYQRFQVLPSLLCQLMIVMPWNNFPNLEPVCCSVSSSNCCFVTCIKISQEAGQVVWYSHLFKNFPVCCSVSSVQSPRLVQLFVTPTDCSMPGFPVHHQLPELTKTHVHGVCDAIQQSHPLLSPSLPAFNLCQHQGLFQ